MRNLSLSYPVGSTEIAIFGKLLKKHFYFEKYSDVINKVRVILGNKAREIFRRVINYDYTNINSY